MPVRYDPSIMYQFAQSLYARASRIVFLCCALGLFVGFGGGALAAAAYGRDAPGLPFVVCIVVGSIVGAVIGEALAFGLRLRAQQVLCQVKIEENTRFVADATAMATRYPQGPDGAQPPPTARMAGLPR